MNLIYVISLPRSGSTLLQRILNTNKRFCTLPETWFLLSRNVFKINKHGSLQTGFYVNKNALSAFKKNAKISEQFFFNQSVKEYRNYLKINFPSKDYFIEKTPRNILLIEEIFNSLQTNDKIIVITRDKKNIFKSYLNYFDRFPYLKAYKFWNEIEYYDEILEHFISKNNHDSRVLKISYEELIKNTDITISRLDNFLDFKFDQKHLYTFSPKNQEKFFGDKKNIHSTSVIIPDEKKLVFMNLIVDIYTKKTSFFLRILFLPFILPSYLVYLINPRLFRLMIKPNTFTH